MKKYTISEYKDLTFEEEFGEDKKTIVAEGNDFMQVSDGYHTMDELYHHRIILYIALCRSLMGTMYHTEDSDTPILRKIWRSKLHSDGSSFDGWFVLGIGKEKGEQITYHLPLSEWGQTEFAETLEKAPEFDGHTSDDVLLRLTNL